MVFSLSELRKPPRKPQTSITRTEFFEDEHDDIGGPYQFDNPDAIKAFTEAFAWLNERLKQHPIYNEEANARIIEKYSARAEQETKHIVEAKSLIERCQSLRGYLKQGDLHGAVYAAMLVQEAYMRLILKAREPDAKTGRIHKDRSREGATEANRKRKKKSAELALRIVAEYRSKIDSHDRRQIVGLLARRFGVASSTIRRHLKKAGIH